MTTGSPMTEIFRREVVHALARYAYQYKPGGFTLTSGAVSDDYLDCKQALGRAAPLWLLGKWLCSEGILLPEVTAIGGFTMGADPIAIACALTPTSKPPPCSTCPYRHLPPRVKCALCGRNWRKNGSSMGMGWG